MKISSFFKGIQWTRKSRRANIVNIEVNSEELILRVSLRRRLVPYKNKHLVSLGLVNVGNSFCEEGLLHKINDLEYEYLFKVHKSHFSLKNELLYLFIKVGDKRYLMELSEDFSSDNFSVKNDLYQYVYIQKGEFDINKFESLLTLTPKKVQINDEAKEILIYLKNPTHLDNCDLHFFDQKSTSSFTVPVQSMVVNRRLKLIGDLQGLPEGQSKWEIILGIQTNEEKSYYHLTEQD